MYPSQGHRRKITEVTQQWFRGTNTQLRLNERQAAWHSLMTLPATGTAGSTKVLSTSPKDFLAADQTLSALPNGYHATR